MNRNRTYNLRRLSKSIATGLALAIVASGCADSDEPDANGADDGVTTIKTIAFGDPTTATPQFKAVGDDFQAAAEKLGIKVFRFDNAFDATKSLDNARLMVQRKPDVIVNWSVSASANPAVGKVFKDAGIPCVALNVEIPGCSLFNQESKDMGVQEAERAVEVVKERGWDIDNTTLLINWAPLAGPEVNELPTYFYSTFAKSFPSMEQVDPSDIPLSTTTLGDNAVFVDGGAVLEQSNKVVTQALQSIPKGRNIVLLVLNDESGFGAKQALSAAGREKDAVIVANVASKEGLDQLRNNPNWIVEGSTFFDLWGRFALAMAMAKVDGQDLPELTGAPIAILTPDNVDEYYDEATVLKAPDYLPTNEYLKTYLDKVGGPLAK